MSFETYFTDNSLGVPVLLLVGTYGLKVGKWFGISNPSFILWICAVRVIIVFKLYLTLIVSNVHSRKVMCVINFAITIYLHKVVEVKRKSRKISEKTEEKVDNSRIRYISECLTDTNASLARLAE